jgi:replicative DNA helicase
MTPTDPPVRTVPHNIEAEQALLGAILINNAARERVSDFLEPGHFFYMLHGKIYAIASQLIASGKQADPITLKTFFANAEPVDASTTVPQYLGRLAARAATVINARDYGRTIHDLATRRGLILIGEDMVNVAYEAPVDFPPSEQIKEVEARLYAIAERSEHAREIEAASMYADVVAAADLAHKAGGPPGLSTGFRNIDAKAGKLQPGHLVILAARPAMGKTALATEIVRRQSGVVHFFSLEMSAKEIAERNLSAETGIPTNRIRAGDLRDEEWRRLLEAQRLLEQRPLVVDPTAALSIAQLAARARRLKRKRQTSLIVVDYLQLMKGTRRVENRTLEVAEITVGLKALAKDLEVPVIALSQLSREVEKRDGKRPQLSDLRESGSIEQDADCVLFLYREEYYLEQNRPSVEDADWTSKMAAAAGKAEVIVAKNRHGPNSVALLQFDGPTTRFSDLVHGGYSSNSQWNSR